MLWFNFFSNFSFFIEFFSPPHHFNTLHLPSPTHFHSHFYTSSSSYFSLPVIITIYTSVFYENINETLYVLYITGCKGNIFIWKNKSFFTLFHHFSTGNFNSTPHST